MTRDNKAWQRLEADTGFHVQSDGTPFPRSDRPILAGGQGRSPRDIRDSSTIILYCLFGGAGAILGYLIRVFIP